MDRKRKVYDSRVIQKSTIRLMESTEIFRRYNFLLLNKILDNGENTIEAVCFTDPNNEIFNQPINQLKQYGCNSKIIARELECYC